MKYPFRRAATSCLLACIAVSPLAAQSWSQLTPSGAAPGGRIYHTLVFDSVRDRAVMFGGFNGTSEFNDTWEWIPSSSTWAQRSPTLSPAVRQVMAATYDAARGRTVVWGGFSNNGGFLADTWEWNGANWTQAASSGPIPGRCASVMVYDSVRQRSILFGGQGQTNFSNDVWEWNGAAWTQTFAGTQSATAPSPRFFHNMVYDAGRRRVVMFGGSNGASLLSDTWAWDPQASTWTQLASTGPSARGQFGMMYDPSLDKTLLYGGEASGGQSLGDCWILDGNTWTQSTSTSTPPARRRHVIAYRPTTGKSLMFAGQQGGGVIAENWLLDTSADAKVDSVVPALLTTTNTPLAVRDVSIAALPTGGALFYGGTTAQGRQPFTYVLSGTNFALQLPSINPAWRADAALAIDPARLNNVLFGGRNPAGVALGDTWTWASGQWTLKAPAVSPPARSGHRVAFDSLANVLLMFGGKGANNQELGDFWAWNGSNWAQRTPATLPPARAHHVMAFDARRGRTVLHGGIAAGNRFGDLWEYDGLNWLEASAARRPSERHGMGMVRDSVRNTLVLYGGTGASGFRSDTWTLATSTGQTSPGLAWSRRDGIVEPPARNAAPMAFDASRGKTVLFGGFDGNVNVARQDTWEFDGVTWLQRNPTNSPGGRWNHAMTYDAARNRVVLFGGVRPGIGIVNETWEYDGVTWTQRQSLVAPAGRAAAAMVFDPVRNVVVMFGGFNINNVSYADTWEWNGTDWTLRSTAATPSARFGQGMAYDAVRNVVVMFGGSLTSTDANDTWTYNGTNWTLKSPTTAPVGRSALSLAWDAQRSRVVLFGGASASFTFNYGDTWDWDGSNWTQSPLVRGDGLWNPGARDGHSCAYDVRSERVVVHGGNSANGCKDDLWSWNGVDWVKQLSTGARPSARSGAQLWFDPSSNEVRLFGGGCGTTFQNDLWSLALPVYSRSEMYGIGCAGVLGLPTLTVEAPSAPIVGTTFNLRLTNIPGVILPAVAAYGYSRTLWNGLPLPVDLAAVGLPGCNLYNSAEATFGLTAPNGTGTILWPVQIPNNPALLGGEVFLQTLQFELPGWPRWGGVSNGVAIRIGDR